MNLYEMTGYALALYEMFTDGDIDEQTVNDTLESIGVDGKLEEYCKVINQLKADIAMVDGEIKRLTDAKKRADKGIESMEARVLEYMTATQTEKKKVGTFELKVKKSTATNIVDEDAIPDEYIRYEQVKKVDKAAILKELRADKPVPGCALQTNVKINIK